MPIGIPRRGRAVRAGALLAIGLAWVLHAPAAALSQPPDGRGYELVSPTDKNGGDVVGDGTTVIAAADGSAVAFASRVSFADTVGSGAVGQTQYVARRAADSWLTHAITPTPVQGATQLFLGSTSIPLFSTELDRSLVWAYDLPGVQGDAPGVGNVYQEDTATRGLVPLTVSQADPILRTDFPGPAPWGVSADVGHVALVSRTRLLPQAPAGVPNAYRWDDGVLSLAGVLPDGSVPAAGSDVAPQGYRGAMTPDGSALAFVSPPTGSPQLYVRGGSRTVWVSQPESSGFVGDPTDVALEMMTGDGRHVLFTTSSRLLDADTNSGPDLYLYTDSPNPATDSNLTLISNTGNVGDTPNGAPLLGASQDATRIYYQDTANELVLWDHGVTKVLSHDLTRSYSSDDGAQLGLTTSHPGASRVTDDGGRVAFLTRAMVDTRHGLTGQVTNGHVEMYAYDAASDALTCVSCPAGRAATADVTVIPQATDATARRFFAEDRSRYLSSDGRRVFFSTPEALVPEDVNGVSDVYEYDVDARSVALVSSGQGRYGAWFADASTNGDDVFFVTRDAYVPTDRDQLVDLYDARVGGGFPPPPPPPPICVGDACQGPETAAPGEPVAGPLPPDVPVTQGRAAISGSRVLLGSRGALHVRVSGKGRLTWSGRGLRRGAKAVGRQGTYALSLVLTPAARRQLARHGTYRVKLQLTFAPAGGQATDLAASVTFKAQRTRKGRR